MENPRWLIARDIERKLVAEGWHSPDTYSNFFRPIGDFPAVYLFLMHERELHQQAFVAYVGMSGSLAKRLTGHEVLKDLGRLDLFAMRWFKPVERADLRDIERSYIGLFQPPWNLVGRAKGVRLSAPISATSSKRRARHG